MSQDSFPLAIAEEGVAIMHDTEVVIGKAKGIIFFLVQFLEIVREIVRCVSLYVFFNNRHIIVSVGPRMGMLDSNSVHELMLNDGWVHALSRAEGEVLSFEILVKTNGRIAPIVVNNHHPIARACFSEPYTRIEFLLQHVQGALDQGFVLRIDHLTQVVVEGPLWPTIPLVSSPCSLENHLVR